MRICSSGRPLSAYSAEAAARPSGMALSPESPSAARRGTRKQVQTEDGSEPGVVLSFRFVWTRRGSGGLSPASSERSSESQEGGVTCRVSSFPVLLGQIIEDERERRAAGGIIVASKRLQCAIKDNEGKKRMADGGLVGGDEAEGGQRRLGAPLVCGEGQGVSSAYPDTDLEFWRSSLERQLRERESEGRRVQGVGGVRGRRCVESAERGERERGDRRVSAAERRCVSCGCSSTPCWRPSWYGNSGLLCNSCGLRQIQEDWGAVSEQELPAYSSALGVQGDEEQGQDPGVAWAGLGLRGPGLRVGLGVGVWRGVRHWCRDFVSFCGVHSGHQCGLSEHVLVCISLHCTPGDSDGCPGVCPVEQRGSVAKRQEVLVFCTGKAFSGAFWALIVDTNSLGNEYHKYQKNIIGCFVSINIREAGSRRGEIHLGVEEWRPRQWQQEGFCAMDAARSQASGQHRRCSETEYGKDMAAVFMVEHCPCGIAGSLDGCSIGSRVYGQAVAVLSRFPVCVSRDDDSVFGCSEISALSSVLLDRRGGNYACEISCCVFCQEHKKFCRNFTVFSFKISKAITDLLVQPHLNSQIPKQCSRPPSQPIQFLSKSTLYKLSYCDFILDSGFFPLRLNSLSSVCSHDFVSSKMPVSFWMDSPLLNTYFAPPITQAILQELELQEILKNVQLRHDIVHDTNLQFRPNLDGERGERKQHLADRYWKNLKKEIEQIRIFQSRKNNINPIHGFPHTIRIFVLFIELRNILLNLLPSSNKTYIIEILDPNLIVQEIIHNLFDIEKFVEHLVKILKQHCAPMRDILLDKMAKKVKMGLKVNNVSKFVAGLRMIFDILEIMKLDIANHQLRTLKTYFLETAVEFEQKWFIDRINWGDIDISDALSWYCHFYHFHIKSDLRNFDYQKAFVDGVIASITYISLFDFPSTFTFDIHRLILLRSNIRDIVSFQLILLLFWQLLRTRALRLSRNDIIEFKRELWFIVNKELDDNKWLNNIPSISTQIFKYINLKESCFPNMLDSTKVTIIENWLSKHLFPFSSLYRLVENRILKSIGDEIFKTLCISNEGASLFFYDRVLQESYYLFIDTILGKLSKIVIFHWKVFGRWYIDSIRNKSTST
ncbi:hypothetical protein PMAC_002219 [Pneumocystis sp. 'macacae']|nr:hypothetical protein PMAC_002219 [Pneumocystis sp. 'macacae']